MEEEQLNKSQTSQPIVEITQGDSNLSDHQIEEFPEDQTSVNFTNMVTQTQQNFSTDHKPIFLDTDNLENFSGNQLIHKYHELVYNFVKKTNASELSELRNEICERTQRRLAFQQNSFGKFSNTFDDPPSNLYATFTPSLFFTIYTDHFTFSSSEPGFDIIGNINDDEGSLLLFYISHGLLIPGTLKRLRELNLTWYDGSLICEVIDNRRKIPNSIRTNLRPTPEDIAECGFESEQSFLLAQYPLLCLEPNKKVAEVSRTIMSDRQRWENSDSTNESSLVFASRVNPDLLLDREIELKEETKINAKQQEDEFRKRMIKRILNPN